MRSRVPRGKPSFEKGLPRGRAGLPAGYDLRGSGIGSAVYPVSAPVAGPGSGVRRGALVLVYLSRFSRSCLLVQRRPRSPPDSRIRASGPAARLYLFQPVKRPTVATAGPWSLREVSSRSQHRSRCLACMPESGSCQHRSGSTISACYQQSAGPSGQLPHHVLYSTEARWEKRQDQKSRYIRRCYKQQGKHAEGDEKYSLYPTCRRDQGGPMGDHLSVAPVEAGADVLTLRRLDRLRHGHRLPRLRQHPRGGLGVGHGSLISEFFRS